MAKTSTERSRNRRERLRPEGVIRCEVYAHQSLHAQIKAYAEKLIKKWARKVLASAIEAEKK